jgi:hypothetical protein
MTLLIEFLGLYLLAASMQQHRAILLGGWRSIAALRTIAAAGWLLLALSLGLAVAGRPTDIVTWFGFLPLACGAILLGISFAPQLIRALVTAGLAGGLVAIFLV